MRCSNIFVNEINQYGNEIADSKSGMKHSECFPYRICSRIPCAILLSKSSLSQSLSHSESSVALSIPYIFCFIFFALSLSESLLFQYFHFTLKIIVFPNLQGLLLRERQKRIFTSMESSYLAWKHFASKITASPPISNDGVVLGTCHVIYWSNQDGFESSASRHNEEFRCNEICEYFSFSRRLTQYLFFSSSVLFISVRLVFSLPISNASAKKSQESTLYKFAIMNESNTDKESKRMKRRKKNVSSSNNNKNNNQNGKTETKVLHYILHIAQTNGKFGNVANRTHIQYINAAHRELFYKLTYLQENQPIPKKLNLSEP